MGKNRTLIVISLCLLVASISADLYNTNTKVDAFEVAQKLRSGLSHRAGVYLRGSPEYESARPVHNGACRAIYPLLITVPMNTEDVSLIVRVANYYGLELSKRSGGHSFSCQGIMNGALHVDLRSLIVVEKLSDHAVRLGGGNTFKRILEIIKPEKYTLVHGQSLSVGISGFVQGVGINPMGMTQRHGYGAEQVLKYTVVLADGAIAEITKYNTTIVSRDGHPVYEVFQHGYDNDLHYAMRGAGSSFGIITELVYKIYPQPETLSCFLLVYIENSYDFMKLNKAAMDGRYTITAFEPFLLRRPMPAHLMAWTLIKFPQFFKWKQGRRIEPTFVSITDPYIKGRKTPGGPAVAFLKSYGLDVSTDNEAMIEKLTMDMVNLAVADQEAVYITHDEYKREGYHAMASANLNGLQSFKAIEDIYFNHPVVGIKSRKTPRTNQNKGCDFCLWILHSHNPEIVGKLIQDTETGPVAISLDCTFNIGDPEKAHTCPKMIKDIKKQIVDSARKYGEDPYQYVNTPSCDKQDKPFGPRYWGNSYPRLLKIKEYWDPQNVFHHCQSVGSYDDDCCATI